MGSANWQGGASVNIPGGIDGKIDSIFIRRDYYSPDESSLSQFEVGTTQTHDLIHEVGHALGLNHPTHQDESSGTLDPIFNKMWFSTLTDNGPRVSGWGPVTPSLFDAVGMEELYGLRNTNETDAYVFQDLPYPTGKLIVDSAGTDIIDASRTTTDNEIDLRATDFAAGKAYFSSIGVPAGRSEGYNVAIYEGTLIENATGGSGKDHIVGNDVANVLNGGAGNDTLEGGLGDDTLNGGTDRDVLLGGENHDTLNGGSGVDVLDGGAGNDVLEGGADNDTLQGGADNDTYIFNGNWGKDTLIEDSGGQNSILKIDGQLLSGTAEGAVDKKKAPYWKLKIGTQTYELRLVGNGAQQDLVVNREGSQANTITIRNFNAAAAKAGGFMGIELGSRRMALVDGMGDSPYGPAATPGNTGSGVTLAEGGASTLSLFLDQPAKAGAKLRLSVAGSAAGLKVVLGDVTVPADGAEITLVEGQTQVFIALVQDGALTADASAQLVASYAGADGAATSNTLNVELKNSEDDARTYNGDQRALLRGIEIDQGSVVPGESAFNTYKWSATSWATDGTLIGGTAEEDFNDVIDGSGGKDKINGLGGNDALDGLAGDDEIDGGVGDDLIGGGAGSDRIKGGAGNDVILSATGLAVYQRVNPDEEWTPPSGTTVWIAGSNWGVYQSVGSRPIQGGGSLSMDTAGDVIDAGDGDDMVTGGLGNDYIDAGNGDDDLWGHGGDDVIVGGAGDDYILGDGVKDVGYYQTLEGSQHGDDFIDGGEGIDDLYGGGANDVIYGGIGADFLFGDSYSEDQLQGIYHGDDYLDGEDGDDQLAGGGGSDVLYGGSGADSMWGDQDSETNLVGDHHGDDYLDGEEGDDYLVGGGGGDVLFGGAGADELYGDDRQANLSGEFHGSDYLDGGDGEDHMVGGGGDDTLLGGADNDELQGDVATSYLEGQYHGNDLLDGGAGDDRLFGLGRDDVLIGGEGNDYLSGDAASTELAGEYHGNDSLDGGAGNDTMFGGGADDLLRGGDGNDYLVGDDGGLDIAFHGDDTLYGGAGDDTLYAGGGNNFLSGDEGNDVLVGDAGDDTILGGAGNDFLRSGAGDDTLDGGEGSDVYYVALGSGSKRISDVKDGSLNVLVLEGGFNFGLVNLSLGSLMISDSTGSTQIHLDGVDYDDLENTSPIQEIRFSDGVTMSIGQLLDAVPIEIPTTEQADNVRGTSGKEIIYALAGNDVVDGRGGNDLIDLGAGNDIGYGGDGDDTLIGGVGDDQLSGGAGFDTLYGGDGSDVLLAGAGGGWLEGGAGNDELFSGNDDYNHLFGGEGDDILHGGLGLGNGLYGGAGNDILRGGDGINEQLDGGDGDDVLDGGMGLDYLSGGAGIDQLDGGGGADQLDGGQGADAMSGGTGDDEYFVDNAGDTVNESSNEGHDIVFTTIDLVLAENVEDLHILQDSQATHATGNSLNNTLIVSTDLDTTLLGLDGDDTLQAGGGNDLLDGGAGADRMEGWSGDDEYRVDNVEDQIVEHAYDGAGIDSVFSSVSFTLSSNVENLTLEGSAAIEGLGNASDNTINGNSEDNYLWGGSGDDLLIGGEGADWLDGGTWADTLIGGLGDDVYEVDVEQDVIVELQNEGNDTVQSAFDYVLGSNLENLTLTGQAANATGNASDNILLGNDNDNRLDGAGGEDHLEGGLGNDIYVIDSAGDVVIEDVDGGNDTVETSSTFSVSSIANIENVTLTGALDVNATGDDGNNVLIGNAGNNVLDGGLGDDVMEGGAGNDTYIVDADDNRVTERQDEGVDTIIRNFDTTYILESNVENLTLAGTVFRGNGNDLDNVITGNDADNNLLGLGGNDILIGGAGEDALFGSEGQDTLIGGSGDDYYEIDDAGDTIVENAGEGDDFVRSTVSWTLGANVERLALDGTGDLYATGNGLANGLWGNDGNNLLTGGQGNDFLVGGAGNDVYVFNAGDGQDTIDNLDALGATDTLRFGAGIGENDVSAFQSGNSIFFKIRGSSDQIAISSYYAANTTSNGVTQDRKIDRIEFANGTVWDQAMIQTVVDRANNNHSPTVNSGLPTLKASQGNLFTYVVPLSTITDPDVWDSVTYTAKMANGDPLPSWLSFDSQTRTFSGTPTSANIGNLQFVLWGTDNYGYGAGTYVNLTVSPPNRAPVLATALADQSVAEGTAINYTVPTGSFTDPDAGDSLSYTATLSDGTALPSWLSFNASTRKFTGTVPIGALDAVSVRVTATDQGGLAIQDVFNIAVTVQNLTLNGTTSAETLTGRSGNDTINGMGGNDTLIGNAGNDRMIGGTGNDMMSGGTGDDTYVVDSATDVVNESANEGKDTVESSLTWTLGANLENLTLTGTTAISGTGNALDNVLTGNSAVNILTGNAGNDVLDGQAGADTMKGGTGDDTYYVDNASDVVTELANEGTDTVISTLTHTLAANVENLRLNATGAINGTGNTLDNVLYAGAGNNTLNGLGGSDTASYLYAGSAVTVSLASTSAQATGGSGSDTLQNIENLTGSGFNDTLTGSAVANVLDGGAGNDVLFGGAGNDTYRLGRGDGSDTITENDTTAGNADMAQFGVDIAAEQLWFRQVGNNLEVSVIGGTDKFTLNNWYLGNQYHVEQFKTSDGHMLSDSNVQNLVQAMASFSPPAAGQTTLPPNYQSNLNTVIAANWQ
ncbi:Ca2+-binding RTX toxin-like protein [Variovorax sp. 54]|nr:Ca2+-binding RTX toxin-like protein [Variovorax sp. 54]